MVTGFARIRDAIAKFSFVPLNVPLSFAANVHSCKVTRGCVPCALKGDACKNRGIRVRCCYRLLNFFPLAIFSVCALAIPREGHVVDSILAYESLVFSACMRRRVVPITAPAFAPLFPPRRADREKKLMETETDVWHLRNASRCLQQAELPGALFIWCFSIRGRN